jgi:hypothetical protein
LKLDEAVAFAQVLAIPFADLLEPARDSLIALTDHFATDGDGMRRWLVTGVPISVWPGQMRTRQDRELATEYLRDLAWTIVNAAIARDAESRKYAEQQFSAAIKRAQEQAKEGAEG